MQPAPPLASRFILGRWKKEAPETVAELEASGQLLPALNQASEQVTELLYQLTVVQKMDYQAALEIAMNERGSLPSYPAR
ncbi:MAG TPA: hypothetical protein VF283_17415 [Bryobacteraceae bacterium]